MIKKTLIPADPALFKAELIRIKRAKRTLIYKDGSVKVEIWRADKFNHKSKLMHNISSQLDHRRDRAYISEAIYEIIDGEYNEYELLNDCHRDRNLNPEDDLDVGDIFISYRRGWSSFTPKSEYVTGYVIENNMITIHYSCGFIPGRKDNKILSPSEMRELIHILNDAIRISSLGVSGSLISTIHGPICTYDYDYRGHSGRDCGALLTDKALLARYNDFINRVTK